MIDDAAAVWHEFSKERADCDDCAVGYSLFRRAIHVAAEREAILDCFPRRFRRTY